MTFDETIEKLKNHDITDLLKNYGIISMVEDLKDNYATDVKMSKAQYRNFMAWKNGSTNFKDLINRFRFGLGQLSEEQLMQAWLHPEIIKIVDEEDQL